MQFPERYRGRWRFQVLKKGCSSRLGLGTRTLSDSQLAANRQQVPYESEIER